MLNREERVIDLDGDGGAPAVGPETYTLHVECKNCGFDDEADIVKGVQVDQARCPDCGCTELRKAGEKTEAIDGYQGAGTRPASAGSILQEIVRQQREAVAQQPQRRVNRASSRGPLAYPPPGAAITNPRSLRTLGQLRAANHPDQPLVSAPDDEAFLNVRKQTLFQAVGLDIGEVEAAVAAGNQSVLDSGSNRENTKAALFRAHDQGLISDQGLFRAVGLTVGIDAASAAGDQSVVASVDNGIVVTPQGCPLAGNQSAQAVSASGGSATQILPPPSAGGYNPFR